MPVGGPKNETVTNSCRQVTFQAREEPQPPVERSPRIPADPAVPWRRGDRHHLVGRPDFKVSQTAGRQRRRIPRSRSCWEIAASGAAKSRCTAAANGAAQADVGRDREIAAGVNEGFSGRAAYRSDRPPSPLTGRSGAGVGALVNRPRPRSEKKAPCSGRARRRAGGPERPGRRRTAAISPRRTRRRAQRHGGALMRVRRQVLCVERCPSGRRNNRR